MMKLEKAENDTASQFTGQNSCGPAQRGGDTGGPPSAQSTNRKKDDIKISLPDMTSPDKIAEVLYEDEA